MLKPSLVLVTLLTLVTPVSAATCDGAQGYAQSFEGRRTFLWRPEALKSVRDRIEADPQSVPAYAELMAEADKALTAGPWSVTDKTRPPPSGNAHDYVSIAPYWWPDPAKPDGLPYVRRDGEVNPERSTDAYDRERLADMTQAVQALGLAYYYSGERKYAERAADIIRVWFLSPATRMNPHWDYAQGVPGVTPGRPFGIIDGVSLMEVTEAIGLLEPSGVFTAQDLSGLRQWFGELTVWLTTSKNGREEGATRNNHAIFYDLQVTQFALFSGRTDIARTVLSGFGDRLKAQMAPDGSMPEELTRTRSFHYSTWVMQAVYDVASLGECVGVDIWNWQDSEGRSVRKATAFLLGWAGREDQWPWPEMKLDRKGLSNALVRASYGFRDPALSAAARPNLPPQDRLTLIYPGY